MNPIQVSSLRSSNWKIIPAAPGVYWWYFPERYIPMISAQLPKDVSLKIKSISLGNACLYVGVAKSLRQRIKWHSDQNLTRSALNSGFLSTLRLTILALNCVDYRNGEEAISFLFDELSVSWQSTNSKEEALKIEHSAINSRHYPLNIQGNQELVLRPWIRFLKQMRADYRSKYNS